jgi:hypothetical protein
LPTHTINPGVVNRLLRGGLIEIVELKSPYKTRKGNIPHAKITPDGRLVLEGQP